MTVDELIAEMPKDGWRLFGKRLRRVCEGGIACCPITSGVRGRAPSASAFGWHEAGADIGLSVDDVNLVVDAADGYEDLPAVAALRARLLAAVGLKEPTP